MKTKITILVILIIFIFSTGNSFSLDLPKLKLNDKNKGTLSLNKLSSGTKYSYQQLNLNDKRSFKSYSLLDQSSDRENHFDFNNDISARIKSGKDYKPWGSKKHFFVGATEIALLEFIPFAFSAYFKDWSKVEGERDWTKISWKTAYHNLSHGWIYDGDNFLTNFFAHPYHGNLFYNAGRTNGYSFWESSLFAMSGSAIWEHFMETWEPAFNDWVLTSLNGINLGEMMYRMATLIIDNRSRGSTRLWTEIGAAIINPVMAVNRVLAGETGKNFDNPSWRNPEKLKVIFTAGVRKLDDKTGENFADSSVEQGEFEFNLNYGNIYKEEFSTPFSSFRIHLALNTGPFQLAELHGEGNLFGVTLKKKKSNQQFFITSLRYDYTNNPGFLFGSAAINPGFYNVTRMGKNTNFIFKFDLRLSPMSSTPNDYISDTTFEGRNYDFGPLLGADIGLAIRQGPWDIVSLSYTGGRLWTQSDPARSRHDLHYANLKLEYPMKDFFVIGFSAGSYWRKSYYDDFPDIDFKTPIIKLYFKTAVL